MIRLYHRTNESNAKAIIDTGFVDRVVQQFPDGVWLSTMPWEQGSAKNRPADGPVILVELTGITRERMFHEYEVIEPGKPYREFIIPAEILNRYPRRTLSREEVDALSHLDAWNEYPHGEPGATWSRMELESELEDDSQP